MPGAATRIPPELFAVIIGHIGHDTVRIDGQVINYYSLNPRERKEMKRHISSSVLTCRYWATQCRSRLFGLLTLRSSDDVQALRQFTAKPPIGFPPMLSYVRYITAEVRPTEAPWVHNLQIFLSSQHIQPIAASQTKTGEMGSGGGAKNTSIFITLHIRGPLRRADSSRPGGASHRFLSSLLPRTLPSQLRHYHSVIVEAVEFNDILDFGGLLRGIRFYLGIDHIPTLSFRDVRLLAPAQVDRSLIFFSQHPEYMQFDLSECNDTSSLLWTSLAHLRSLWDPITNHHGLQLSINENQSLLDISDALFEQIMHTKGGWRYLNVKTSTESDTSFRYASLLILLICWIKLTDTIQQSGHVYF